MFFSPMIPQSQKQRNKLTSIINHRIYPLRMPLHQHIPERLYTALLTNIQLMELHRDIPAISRQHTSFLQYRVRFEGGNSFGAAGR